MFLFSQCELFGLFYSVAICGGGIASCTAARRLAAKGIDVKIFEAGRGLGGRSSTRRSGELHFDHGLVYFFVLLCQ